MPTIGIAGKFAASLEGAIRQSVTIPCEIVVSDEAGIVSRLADVDVLVTMVLTSEMGRACKRLKLVQVPGAGLDRIERSALPLGTRLANVYGHENGIAEYVIGAMLALTRDFVRLDSALRRGEWQKPMGSWCATAPGLARTQRENDRNSRVWQDWSGGRPTCPRFRHDHMRDAPRCSASRRKRCCFPGRARVDR